MKKLSFILLLALALTASFAQTPIPFTATYSFTGSTGSTSELAYNGTQYSGISMGNILKRFITSVSSDDNFRAKGWSTGFSSPRIEFTIAAAPGYKYTVSSITFGLGRNSTGPRNALWRSSLTGNTNLNNYTLNNSIDNDSGMLTIPGQEGSWTGNVLTLDGMSQFEDITTDCIFKLHMYGTQNTTTGIGGLDGPITITGTYTPTDPTLPVTLSHFSAIPTAQNYVLLTWTSQSESNLLGYSVYRSDTRELSSAVRISDMIAGTNSSQAHVYTFYDQELTEAGTYYYWLQSMDLDGTSGFHGPVSVAFSIGGETGSPGIPTMTVLENAYPNPFNPSTTIHYQLNAPGKVEIVIYNVKGHRVRSFSRYHDAPGRYGIIWDGCDDSGNALASGLYLYKMRSGDYCAIKKLVLQK